MATDLIRAVAQGAGASALPTNGTAEQFETLATAFDAFGSEYSTLLWEKHFEICDALDTSRITVLSTFTTTGFIWLMIGLAVTCLISSGIAILLERFPRRGSLLGLLPISDLLDILTMSFLLDTFADDGCSMRGMIIMFLQMNCVGIWVDIIFLATWIIASKRSPQQAPIVTSAYSWGVTLASGLVMFLCFHVIAGGDMGFDVIKTPYVQKAGTAAAMMSLLFGFFATIALRAVGPALPVIEDSMGTSPPTFGSILKARWKSLLLYSFFMNGTLVFGAGFAAAISFPSVGALFTGLPTEIWCSLMVLSESRRNANGGIAGPAIQLLDSAPTAASLSAITLILYVSMDLQLWVCTLIGFGCASVLALGSWWVETRPVPPPSAEMQPLLKESVTATALHTITQNHGD